jgi:hypothetical protein
MEVEAVARRSHRQPVPRQQPPGPSEQIAVAWVGVSFILIAVAGLALAPGARWLWIVLLVFGAATLPQVTIWWILARRGRHDD